jgi:surfeit locus 1 family protein
LISKRVFRPKLIPTIGFVALFSTFVALGLWQLDRGEEKEVIYDNYLSKRSLPALDLNLLSKNENIDDLIWRRAFVTGRFINNSILLDNQVMNGVPGYFLYTPLRLGDQDRYVLINRGWVMADAYREIIPSFNTPEGNARISGMIKLPPATGIVLDEDLIESLSGEVRRVQRIRIEDLEKEPALNMMPVILRMDEDSAHGYVRKWMAPGFGTERHLGYAFQWFAMAAVLLLIYVIVNLKNKENNNG